MHPHLMNAYNPLTLRNKAESKISKKDDKEIETRGHS